VSEYVRDLVREDQKRQTQENLEALLLEATRSGPGREFTKADWEALRRELAKRMSKRSTK
jgi:Arc/MetJ-type ribon-helix-helix transcriptional regulator